MTNEKSSSDRLVQCTRCNNRHMESTRVAVSSRKGVSGLSFLVCPRCSCKSLYDVRPQVAWCWASGLIDIGDAHAVPNGSIVIARGEKAFLHAVLSAVARQGRGNYQGKFLAPGVPEAADQAAAGLALSKWLTWCAGGNGRAGRHGVVFETEVSGA